MKNMFLANLIVALLFGLGFTLVPHTVVGLYDVTLTPMGITMTRLFGAEILALAVLFYYAWRTGPGNLHKSLLRGNFVYWVLGTVFLVMAQLAGLMNALGWATIGLHVIFVVWFAYYLLK